jgi:microcystin-dependent protein
MAKIRREYSGGAVSTTTTGNLPASTSYPTTVGINANTGWPFGPNKFFVVFSPGTANEEKVLVSRASSGDLALTIAAGTDRGKDVPSGTAATHASGTTVYPVFTALDADEANELTSSYEAKGDLVSLGASTFQRLAVGTNDYVLQADSSTASGLAWGLVDTANLAADAVTTAKIAAGAVDSAELASLAVTEAKLAAAVVSKLVPAGTIVATVATAADTGWLLMGQTVANAQTSYPALWTVAPTSWKSGSSLVLPSMADRVLAGQSATALGASDGANTVTIGTTNLPVHTHSLNNHSHTMTHTHSIDHNHGSQTFSVSGTVGTESTTYVYRLGGGYTTNYVAGYDGNNDGIIDGLGVGAQGGMAVQFDADGHSHGWSGSVAVDLDNFTGTSGGSSAANTGNSSGDTGNGGFANTALNIRNAHVAVNFQIKAH